MKILIVLLFLILGGPMLNAKETIGIRLTQEINSFGVGLVIDKAWTQVYIGYGYQKIEELKTYYLQGDFAWLIHTEDNTKYKIGGTLILGKGDRDGNLQPDGGLFVGVDTSLTKYLILSSKLYIGYFESPGTSYWGFPTFSLTHLF